MTHFKKISVCHGKSCEPAGAKKIKKILEEHYANKSVEIIERNCCGRCEHSCTIVVDDQPVSDLSPHTIHELFINKPGEAIKNQQAKDQLSREVLERALGDPLF